MTKRPLGRGLSALLSTTTSQTGNEELLEIEVDLIRPGRKQRRTTFDEAKLKELAQSVSTSGIIQPLLVRRQAGNFELVAGERRWRAAQIAGLRRVPAIVRDIPDDKLLELALIENIQREELNPIEEANAYKKLIESLGLTQEQVADRVGRDRTVITNHLRILKLPTEIQEFLKTERLSFGHARALLGLASGNLQRRLAQRIVKNNWSVRETERRVRQLSQQQRQPDAKSRIVQSDPNFQAAELKLRRRLATQVRIVPSTSTTPGKIEIEYYNAADLNRLYALLIPTDSLSATATHSL